MYSRLKEHINEKKARENKKEEQSDISTKQTNRKIEPR